jgi:hypothetical protein
VIIISHRGYWQDPAEKNQPVAFHRSFDLGFGTETDVRDLKGELVISHDMPGGDALTLEAMLDILAGRDLPMAMNIKADGLAKPLQAQMSARGLSKWFTFDMSVPEMVVQHRLGLPIYTRASEYETPPALYEQSIGVWLDAFVSEWYSDSDINAFLQDGKQVAIVSPELHKRDHLSLWTRLRAAAFRHHPGLTLCTDLPDDAVAFFGETP